jgi:penicillin-binding protein 1A
VVGVGTFIGGLLAAPIDFAVAPPPTAALLLAADGRQFATILPPERREVVKAADIPQVMRDAMISAEDERFLKHSGVDPLATIRAAFRDLTGSSTQGGSTLTQQYVKNAYVGNERTALRKVREAALAVRLEQKLSKEEILTDYLNALYLGNGLYGVQAASKYYFGVPVKDLALNEKTGQRDDSLALARATIMAGIAPAPSVWNPVKDFATARVRQQYTLNRMVVGGYITPQQASDAFQVDVKPLRESPPAQPTIAPEFADYVKAKIVKSPGYDEDVFFRGGLRIRTTLDLDLQQAFNQALKEVLPDATDPQAAIVAVDYRNGDVKAMATARRVPERVDNKTGAVTRAAVTGYTQKLGFNLATVAQRSTGSTIKPFTLAEALTQGQTLRTTRYAPSKDSIPNPGGTPDPYVYGNSDVSESGRFTLQRALADSINTVYLPLAKEVGRAKVAALAENAGLTGRIKSGNLSFGIGAGVEVTPLSEAVAYATIANGGVHFSPRSYTEVRTGASGTDAGQVLERIPTSGMRRVLKPSVAKDVVTALTDVVTSGTGTAARQPFTVFGKTGTTNDSTDAWFTGCIPDQHVCVATWMGYEDTSCRSATTHVVGVACGGMKNLHGVAQVFGGTLPAKVFARAQELLRQIKADRAARAAGLLVPSPTPTPVLTALPTRRPRSVPTPTTPVAVVPTATAAPRPTATAARTAAPTAAPTSPPPLLFPPPPSPAPSG